MERACRGRHFEPQQEDCGCDWRLCARRRRAGDVDAVGQPHNRFRSRVDRGCRRSGWHGCRFLHACCEVGPRRCCPGPGAFCRKRPLHRESAVSKEGRDLSHVQPLRRSRTRRRRPRLCRGFSSISRNQSAADGPAARHTPSVPSDRGQPWGLPSGSGVLGFGLLLVVAGHRTVANRP